MFELRRISFRAALAVALGCVVVAATAAQAIAAKPLLYLPGYGESNVTGLSTGEGGVLSQVPGSPFGAGTFPFASAATPDGRFLYVTNFGADSVSGYAIGGDGSLTSLGPPTSTPLNPQSIAVSPDGSHLYLASFGGDVIRVYAIDEEGALALAAPDMPTAGEPSSIAFTPDGTRAFVSSFGADSVTGYTVADDGSLTAAPGLPPPTGSEPRDTDVTPDGQYLYVASGGSAGIYGYSIAPGGSLTPLIGSPFGTVAGPRSLTVGNGGANLYATSYAGGEVTAFSIAADGSLTQGDSTGAGAGPIGVMTESTGESVYVADGLADVVRAYGVEADGSLTQLAGSPFALEGTSLANDFAVVAADEKVQGAFLKANRKQRQMRRRIVVKVKVGADEEPLEVRVRYLFGMGPTKVGYRLRGSNLSLAAGQRRVVKLKPASRRAKRQFPRRLRKFRRGSGEIKARYVDDAGNVAVERTRVKIFAKKRKKR